MASTAPSATFEPKDAEDLNKMHLVPSTKSSTTANTATSEPLSKSSNGLIIDEEGFTTSQSIKVKNIVSVKDSREPEVWGKFSARPKSTLQPQSGGSSTSANRGGLHGRPQQHRGPRDEIRIGYLHSMRKRPSQSKTDTAPIATAVDPNTSHTTPNRHPRASTRPKYNQTNKGSRTNIGLSESTSTPSISNSRTETPQNAETEIETKTKTSSSRNSQKTRLVIVFDSNNKLSWADEVIAGEEEAEERNQQQPVSTQHQTKPTNPALPSPAEPLPPISKQKHNPQFKEAQQQH